MEPSTTEPDTRNAAEPDLRPPYQPNLLLASMQTVLGRVDQIREQAKAFYFAVTLSAHACPDCAGRLVMTGVSQCRCEVCGIELDPTLAFLTSPCCGSRLHKRTFHYACVHCDQVVPSRFLFDERVFDADYFRQMMAGHRQRLKARREALRLKLMDSRSGVWPLDQEPLWEDIPGLLESLDSWVTGASGPTLFGLWPDQEVTAFSLDAYSSHILACLTWNPSRFSGLPALDADQRRDRARRFITLIFMEQEQQVRLAQDGPSDLWVERVWHEAHA